MELDVKILLWNNDSLEQIRDDMNGADIAPTGVSQKNPDFGLLARACDWDYAVAGRLEDLEKMLGWLFSTPGPRLLELKERQLFQ